MFKITRQIGIDMGHRVPDHGSKCRSPHGHRYTIEATCEGKLHSEGEETGMVMDFSFLKEEMMQAIDAPFDHAFCIWSGDQKMHDMFFLPLSDDLFGIAVREVTTVEGFKVIVIDVVPTAENLAAVWFNELVDRVDRRTKGEARLLCVKVWETPNCWAQYPAEDPVSAVIDAKKRNPGLFK